MGYVVINDLYITLGITIIMVLIGQLVFILGIFKWSGGTMLLMAKIQKHPIMVMFRQEGGALMDRIKPGKMGRIMWYKDSPLLKLSGQGDIRPGFSATNSGVKIGTFYSLKNFTIPPELPLAFGFYDQLGFKGKRFEADLLNYYIASKNKKQPEKVEVLSLIDPEELKKAKTNDERIALFMDAEQRSSSGTAFLDDLKHGDSILVYSNKTLRTFAETVKNANNIADDAVLQQLMESHLKTIPNIEDSESLPANKVPVVFWSSKHGLCCRIANLMLDWGLIKSWMYTNLRSDIMQADINEGVEERFEYLSGIARYMPIIALILFGCGGLAVVMIVAKLVGLF